MTNVTALVSANGNRWDSVKTTRSGFRTVANRLVASKARYQIIEAATGVPWFIIAVIHEREASQNFGCQLAQGDPLGIVSVHVPKGRGPFFNHPDDPPGQDAFYRGALDALIDCAPHAATWKDWSPGGALTLLEQYNGLGYANRGRPSPYIWAGTNQYVSGKYIADGVYDPNAVDEQLGCAGLIVAMMAIDPSIKFGDAAHPDTHVAIEHPAAPAHSSHDAKQAKKSSAKKKAGGAVIVGAGAAAAAASRGFPVGVVIAMVVFGVVVAATIWFSKYRNSTPAAPVNPARPAPPPTPVPAPAPAPATPAHAPVAPAPQPAPPVDQPRSPSTK